MDPSNTSSTAAKLNVWYADTLLGKIGIGTLGTKAAILIWDTSSGTVALRYDTGDEIFQVNVSDVDSVQAQMGMIHITIRGKVYKMVTRSKLSGIVYGASLATGGSAGLGIGIDTVQMERAGIENLVTMVKQAGGKGRGNKNIVKVILETFVIGFAVIVLGVVALFIVYR